MVKKQKGICAYCGIQCDILQIEHVVAECFFATPPKHYVKVMSCPACNKVVRGFPLMPSAIRNVVLNAPLKPLFLPSRLYAGRHRSYPIGPQAMQGLRFIVRGLYYDAVGKVFPSDYHIEGFNNWQSIEKLDYLMMLLALNIMALLS